MAASARPKRKKSGPVPDVFEDVVQQEMTKELRRRTNGVTSEAEFDRIADELLEQMPDIVTTTMASAARREADEADAAMDGHGRKRRATMRGFAKRLAGTWGEGFDRFEMLIDVLVPIGAQYHERRLREKSTSSRAYALVQLHARAARVGSEVLTLLKAGFADGAMARSRTLHEIAVVAGFLAQHGDETAERYLKHQVINACKSAEMLDTHAADLGWDPVDPAELQRLRAARARLIEDYGKPYEKDFGWAAGALNTKELIGLPQLMAPLKLSRWRPFYRWASDSVHAGPGGFDPIGVEEHGRELMLVGPSNAGLLDPAQLAVFSLRFFAAALLLTESNGDLTIQVKAFDLLAERCIAAFSRGHDAVEALKRSDRERRATAEQKRRGAGKA